MEIDKDKVVEAAKVYINATQKYLKEGNFKVKGLDEYLALKEALNPPPPRPSKEECIDWLAITLVNCFSNSSKSLAKATIDYLKEPSLQWVKNTGVKPEYKVVVVRFRHGGVCCFHSQQSLRWHFASSDDEFADNDVIEYIILE